MDREEFVKWICGVRKCAASSGTTNYYNLRRIRKVGDYKEPGVIPKNPRWVSETLYKKLNELTSIAKKNLSGTLVAYLKASKAPEDKIKRAKKFMKDSVETIDQIYKSQVKSKKQKANWLTHKKVVSFLKETNQKVQDRELFSKTKWSPSERRMTEDLLILAIHSNNPPRLEFSQLVYTKNKTKPNDKNWLFQERSAWFVVINKGKVISKKGAQKIKLGPVVARILNKFKKYLKPERAVFTTLKGVPITQNAYGKRLRGLFKRRFGKSVSANILRAVFLTTKYGNMPSLKNMEETSHAMMHDTKTALSKYVKR